MEKKFIQLMLFSTTIIVVYAMVPPPLVLSAEDHPLPTLLNESTHVRKGTIVTVDPVTQTLVVDFGGVSVSVLTDASTTVDSPNGEETRLSFLRDGSAIYVFGYYNKDARDIEAEKIVMRNKSLMGRTTLSRAETEMIQNTGSTNAPSVSDSANLSVK